MLQDEELLLAVLNSAPVVQGTTVDQLEGQAGRDRVRSWGGTGSVDEVARLRQVRQALRVVVRGEEETAVDELRAVLECAVQTPRVSSTGIVWVLQAPADDRLAVETVQAWSRVSSELPGRLRACANHECNLFLVDHSRPGTAKWCSMAVCGNRAKARTHAQRSKIGRPLR